MTTENDAPLQLRLSGFAEPIQSALIEAGLAESEMAKTRSFFADNDLTLNLNTNSWAFTPRGATTRKVAEESEQEPSGAVGNFQVFSDAMPSMKDLLSVVMGHVVELSKNPTVVTGFSTGFLELDEQTTGLQPGQLTLVAGYPSIGKTAFSLNIAEHVALEIGLPVLIFSLELSGAQITGRMLSSIARVDKHRLRTGQLDGGDWDRLNAARVKLQEATIRVNDNTRMSVNELGPCTRRMYHRCRGLGLIIVDRLQLISVPAKDGSDAIVMSKVVRYLKALAKELRVPVVLISQLTRASKDRINQRPLLSDLRDYGDIEQVADVILFIHRDDESNDDSREITIAKQRNGPVGTVKLKFSPQYTRFDNFAS